MNVASEYKYVRLKLLIYPFIFHTWMYYFLNNIIVKIFIKLRIY